jgi:DNA polymerase-3 subunit delta
MSFNIQKALQNRVIGISGGEELLIRRAINDLIAGAGLEKDDYDLQHLSGDANPPSDWLGSVGTIPFLAPRRIVVVKNATKAKPEDISGDSLKALPETSLLILVLDEDSTGDERKGGTKKKTFEKVITQAGGAVFSFELDPKKAKEDIRSEVAKRGKTIHPQALELLTEMVGGSVSRAYEELDKLVLFAAHDQISEGDVRSIVVASREWNIWRMIDTMIQGDIPECLRQLKIILSNKDKVEDVAFGQLFPLVSRQLRLLYQGRLCLDAGVTPDRPGELINSFPHKPNITSISDYQRNSVMRASRNLSLTQIGKAMQHLSEADARLKGMGASFSGMDTIERLVFDLASTLNPKRA